MKNSLIVKSFFFLTVLLTSFNTRAQTGSGTLSGKLIDADNNQPLSFASVSVIRKADNKPVTGLQTDMDGNFKIGSVADGVYIVRFTYVAYLTVTRDTVNINPKRRNVQFGVIKMHPSKGALKEVKVTAQRSQIQLGVDKKSFNVEQSLVSQGGSATDLLTNVPSVQVDVDGNVSLRGSTNVRILINGKPSTLTGGDLTDILQSIPASSIETIEVITNPSSKYEAEGQSGIINIVLKKNASLGMTGSVSGSVGTQHTYNGSLNLAYQNKNINIYGNYSYRRADRVGNGFTDKVSTPVDGTTGTIQTQDQANNQSFTFGGHNIRTGIDYNLNKNNTISFSDNINIRNRDRYQTGGTDILDGGDLTQKVLQDNKSTGRGISVDLNLDYDHKFKKPQEELTASVGYSHGHDNNYDYLNSQYYYYDPAYYNEVLQNNHTLSNEHNITLQSDYTLPLKNGKLEAGYRSTFNQSDNNYIADTLNTATGVFDFDPFISNRFLYKENVNAVYTNYQHTFGSFSIQGGLRLEDAHIRTTLIDTAQSVNHKQDYFRVYPSLFLTEKLDENQTLQLSYSRRVTRPRDRQLSPFLDVSNRLAYQQGNPDLLPEDTHSFELSYIDYWKGLTLTSSLYYRLTNDNIQQITTPLTPANRDTTLTQFQNIKSASNAGYELIAKLTATKFLDLTANVNVYYRHIAGDPQYDLATTSGYAWNGNLTANIKATKALAFQFRGDYQGPQVIAQGKMKAMGGLDGGLRYDITKKLNVSANVRDIFNTRKFGSDIVYNNQYYNIAQVSERRFATRTAIFTMSYRFGSSGSSDRKKANKNNNQNQQQDQDNSPDDMGGGNGGGQGNGGGAGRQQKM